ncbi:MAG: hypothetical protein L0H96_14700 [Humibacillus sp.]|nr:hypothetical protein [Humibacillus sp.]
MLRFARHSGWEVVTNFGSEDFRLGVDEVLLSSGRVVDGTLPEETTAWVAPRG